VALTFDAEHPSRPHAAPDTDRRIQAALEEAGAPATFFLQGRWATAHPDRARAIATGGHLVGNHSHYHASFPLLTEEGLRSDLARAEEAIVEATGVDPRPWFRFPFGDGEDMPDITERLSSVGYRHVGWHVDPNDWEPARSAGDVERSVVDGVLARGDGAIVLLHAWPRTTADALPGILAALEAEGARFERLDALPGIPGSDSP